jgi:hypothetical protein
MSTSMQDAVALLTVAMGKDGDELDGLIEEFTEDRGSHELLVAVVGLCRSLCLATSRMVHALDDELTNEQALGLSNDEVLPVAMEVVRRYAHAAALDAGEREQAS